MALAEPIQEALEERKREREELERAGDLLVEALSDGEPKDAEELMARVSEQSGVPVSVVQRALWKLIHERQVEILDDLDIAKSGV